VHSLCEKVTEDVITMWQVYIFWVSLHNT